MRCSCGLNMATQTTTRTNTSRVCRPYYYYRCSRRKNYGISTCSQKGIPATTVGPLMWDFVAELLKDPERIRLSMNALIDQEREAGCRDTVEEVAAWAKKAEECDLLRSAYQDQQAAGYMTLEELGSKLKGLEETRRLAQAELSDLEAREERVKELERDRDALIESWAGMVPEALDGLTGQEKNEVYRMLRLEVTPTEVGYRVAGALPQILHFGTDATAAAPTPIVPPAGSNT